MQLHFNPNRHAPRRRFDRAPGELECLRCRHVFNTEELGRIRDIGHERTYIQCAWCDARNEVRAVPQPGLGTPPDAVVVGILSNIE